MISSSLKLLDQWLEKAKVAHHEHDDFQERLVVVKNNKEYLSSSEKETKLSANIDWNKGGENNEWLEKQFRRSTLIPYRVMVNRPNKAPYFSTRWKRVYIAEPTKQLHFHIVPIKDFKGDLNILYSAWKQYIGSLSEERQELLLPLLALQEILYKDYDGILAVVDNRVIGIASIKVTEEEDV